MDDRQGNIYPTLQDALAAGVPPKHIQTVEPEFGYLRVTSGPFKGRLYRRTATGLERVEGFPSESEALEARHA